MAASVEILYNARGIFSSIILGRASYVCCMGVTATAKRTLLKASAVITAFTLISKLLGTFLRLYLSARIGSEGMGLHSLIMSVYTVFTTLATAGFTFAVSRLSAECGRLDEGAGYKMYAVSLIPALFMGILSCFAMLGISDRAAVSAVGDVRTAAALKTLALSLPFMSLTSCMKGLFLARRQVFRNGSGSLLEQIVKITFTAIVLGMFMQDETRPAMLCLGISAGITAGEIFSLIYLGMLSLTDRGRSRSPTVRDGIKQLLQVGSPVAVSVYATSLLHSGESILIPAMLQNFSGDRAEALSSFGVIRGMVIPLLFFPFSFLGALTSVLVPELSYLRAFGDEAGIKKRVGDVVQVALLFGIAAGGIFFIFAAETGLTFYPAADTYLPLRVLALVTPFMYVETVADSMLKALGEERSTLLYSLVNSALRIACIIVIIPKTGAVGYLAILFISNLLQYAFATLRLKRKCGYTIDILRGAIIPAFGMLLGGAAGKYIADGMTAIVPLKLGIGCVICCGIFMLSCIPVYRRYKNEKSY